ncbi:hypothetical protein CEXT_362671 [Caerostris extrusa]|uniref:Uncharacterized protein n=1 Tax=Caerostris extrusa TaxID=172846 RepID=A0AAV4XB11_CAEEX|nr:hypothetical protein CEXT_362671 [Caerostris extrusa]
MMGHVIFINKNFEIETDNAIEFVKTFIFLPTVTECSFLLTKGIMDTRARYHRETSRQHMKNVARHILTDFEAKSSLFNKTKLLNWPSIKLPPFRWRKNPDQVPADSLVRCSIFVRTEHASDLY